MTAGEAGKLALLWRGDRRARSEATAQNNRLNRVFEALAALGIQAEPAVYAEDMADEVRSPSGPQTERGKDGRLRTELILILS